MFAPGRSRSLKETGATFERPPDFRIADFLDGTFRVVRGAGPPVTVRLRFSPAAARYIRERTWHPSQKLTPRPGGRLEMTLRVNHLLEVKRWVMSFAANCEVLEPAQLRMDVAGEHLRAARQYGRA
jgi:proteasome accessory factor B